MSDAAFTDSTTPRLENWRMVAPFSGSSTKTTSPSCSCAKCVMPMVAVSPSRRTHSCSFEYRRSDGTVTSHSSYTTTSLRDVAVRAGSFLDPAVKRRLHYRSRNVLFTDAHRECSLHLR